jgi:hypothetical protein
MKKKKYEFIKIQPHAFQSNVRNNVKQVLPFYKEAVFNAWPKKSIDIDHLSNQDDMDNYEIEATRMLASVASMVFWACDIRDHVLDILDSEDGHLQNVEPWSFETMMSFINEDSVHFYISLENNDETNNN